MSHVRLPQGAFRAHNFRRLLQDAEIGNHALTGAMGVHKRTVTNWLNGSTQPNKAQVLHLTELLKVGYEELVDTTVDESKPDRPRDKTPLRPNQFNTWRAQRLMEARGLSLVDLALEIGTTNTMALSRWLNGNANPTPSRAHSIALALRVPYTYLVSEAT